jgi:ferredoxin-NADP reductase
VAASGSLTAALVSRAVIAPGIADLVFGMRDPPALAFRAGQFVSLGVGAMPSGQGTGPPVRRSYSIASARDQGRHLRFIIRVIPGGAASDFLMSLPLGGHVRLTGPHGFFVLDAQHAGDVVFGATGTGVSAVMSMLAELAHGPAAPTAVAMTAGSTSGPPAAKRWLYWGVRHEEDLFARAEIEALTRAAGCELRLFLTRPPAGWSGGKGRITGAILDQLPDLKAPTFYLVGNGAMIAELKRELISRGVSRKKQVRTEAFFD